MDKPKHFNCPHCTYAYQAGDPRFAVPKGQAYRVMQCPACKGGIRVRGEGTSSTSTKVIIIVVIAIIIALCLKS